MISICIPVYNYIIVDLIKKLSSLSEKANVPCEIILIDDCSENSYKTINESVSAKTTYIRLGKNIGRAAIRNQFLKYARYDHLLFLDCDVVITSDDFLDKYIDALKQHPNQLICGGREYPVLPPPKHQILRWQYGIHKESKTYVERQKNPYRSFMTNNFVIHKKILETTPFDERLKGYGHEDTLFGFELKKRGIGIIHIDNPVVNGDLENNDKYISQTENAILNLTHILKMVNYDKSLIEDITLLRVYYKLYNIRNLIKALFILTKPIIKYTLLNGYVNLYLFDFYKLGTLTTYMKQAKTIASHT
ncbi:glycosyltransferase family 2 protein [Geofilum sp. OHC36d9]|uniref:glycosyltransferase family 2 protein n=1 Tax=Geofilum sp. OHC36d9 TaxID=3458413 RepID=UPI004034766F